jgi:hypothetical protein
MTRCSPLGEATASVAGAENVDKAIIAAKLERALRGNPATSNGERRHVGPNARDAQGEGGSGIENSWTCYSGLKLTQNKFVHVCRSLWKIRDGGVDQVRYRTSMCKEDMAKDLSRLKVSMDGVNRHWDKERIGSSWQHD